MIMKTTTNAAILCSLPYIIILRAEMIYLKSYAKI